MRQPISADEANRIFRYDASTGKIYWKEKRSPKTVIGAETGKSINSGGYHNINLKEGGIKVHRLAWLMVIGEWPDLDIDHINRIKTDNRWANLRLATDSQNQQNRRAARVDNASSKCMGVGYFAPHNKWRARIQLNKKSIWLGYFDTEAEASAAYAKAKAIHHSFFASGASS